MGAAPPRKTWLSEGKLGEDGATERVIRHAVFRKRFLPTEDVDTSTNAQKA